MYVTPQYNDLEDLFVLNLMTYIIKAAVFNVVKKYTYDTIYIILCGELKINLAGPNGA